MPRRGKAKRIGGAEKAALEQEKLTERWRTEIFLSLIFLSALSRQYTKRASHPQKAEYSKPGQSHPKPPQGHTKATPKPYTRHRLRSTKPPQGHPKATSRLHQSHLKAPPKPPQGSTKATPRLHQGHPKAPPRPPQGSTKATPRPLSSQLIRPVCKSEAQKPPVSAGPWLQCRGALKSVAASLNPKAENRNPKEDRNPKSRKTGRAGGWPGQRRKSFSDFGLRVSFGFRFSAFGFQGRLRRVRCYRSDFRAALATMRMADIYLALCGWMLFPARRFEDPIAASTWIRTSAAELRLAVRILCARRVLQIG